MRTIAYRKAILEAKIPGVTEVTTAECSLMVHFDPFRIRYEDLLKEVKEIEKECRDPDKWEHESRLFEIPLWFDDPWSMECYLANKERYPLNDGSMSNLAFCARYVGLCSVQYLVFCIGFAPGIQGLLPLLERKEDFPYLPRYRVSRPWTPSRVLCGGGVNYSIHPYVLPGGYSMLANTPVPLTSLEPAERILPAIKDRLSLATLGDRFSLKSIEKEEYEDIRARVIEGTYEYKYTSQKWEPRKWMENPKDYKGTDVV
jgi:urea carboxylase